MDILSFYKNAPRGGKRALADKIGVSLPYLYQLATGRRKIPATLCRSLEAATDKRVTVHDLRPDVFGQAPDAPLNDVDHQRAAA